MDAPRVSILLPVYDGARFLGPCLRSIARQTLPDWECIVVDDGSRDGSGDLARRFATRDPRFRVALRPHRGLVGALNHGLDHCRAPLVARMDADDLMHRERLARQVEALEGDARLEAVACRVRLFPRESLGEGMRAYERWLNGIDSPERVRAEAFVECPVAHPALLIRRRALQGLRYRDLDWPEDYDLVLRLLARGGRIGVVRRRLLAWRHGPGRLSRVGPAYATSRFTACKAAFLADGFLARSPHYVLWGYGGTGRALRGALRAHGKQPSAIVEVHPGRLGNRIHGAPVLPPEALAERRGEPVVVSVAGAGPRALIRDALARMGFRETVDYVCAA
ncbi:MAG: glycosyltransferase family 2 protein [Myxococcota bacterium]|nr:glycosyltransferase family 2 protein [Myxococcota bacterium]